MLQPGLYIIVKVLRKTDALCNKILDDDLIFFLSRVTQLPYQIKIRFKSKYVRDSVTEKIDFIKFLFVIAGSSVMITQHVHATLTAKKYFAL